MNKNIIDFLTIKIQFIRYTFFGGFGVLSDIVLYWLLVGSGINYQIANLSGYLLGTLISFFLNRTYTFGVKDKIFSRMLKFFLVALVGYLSSSIILYILIDLLYLEKILSKFVTLFFVLVIQFTLNKKTTFKT